MAGAAAGAAGKVVAGKVAGKVLMGAAGPVAVVVQVAASTVSDLNRAKYQRIKDKRTSSKHDLDLQKTESTAELQHLQQKASDNQRDIDKLKRDIAVEEKRMSTPLQNVKNDSRTMFIVMLGVTGDGKSTICNRLCGDKSRMGNRGPFAARRSFNSVTQELSHKVQPICQVPCVIVDTPGYADSQGRDDLHFNNIAQYLYNCGGVDTFVLVMNATSRFNDCLQTMLEHYNESFGRRGDFWQHFVVVLTHIEGDDKEEFAAEAQAELLRCLKEKFVSIPEELNIPILTVGRDSNIQSFRRAFMRAVTGIASQQQRKLSCKEIKSPIKKQKRELQALLNKMSNFNMTIAKEERQIKTLGNQMKNIDRKLNDKSLREQWPLFCNPKEDE